MTRLGCSHYSRLVFSSIGVLVGLSASIAFAFIYGHLEAAAWAFSSAVFASVCLKLHVLVHYNRLHQWHSKETLRDVAFLGLMAWAIGFASMIWYIFTGLYHHRGIMPLNDCPYISAVWSFMTGKWGMIMFFNSRTYIQMLHSGLLPLPLLEE